MKHYSQTQWADYSRGVLPQADRASMQKHLDKGCQKCRRAVDMWKYLAEMAKRESTFEPPEGALRVAESYFFPLKLALRNRQNLKLAQCRFDSLEQRAQGIRGVDVNRRQLMYQSGDVFIDMNWGETADRTGLALTGQVVNATVPTGVLEGIPVSLVSGANILFDITTSEFGEFQFSLKAIPERDLKLVFKINEEVLLLLLPNSAEGIGLPKPDFDS